MTATTDVTQYVKSTITIQDLIPIFIELDRASQLKVVQLYPSVIAILKSVVKTEYINEVEDLDVETVTAIVEYFKQKIPLTKIMKILNGETVDVDQTVVAKYCKDKIKIRDLRVIFEQFDKQMQTNTTNLYMTVIALLKVVLRDDFKPEEIEINDAVELIAYAMTKIDLNRIQSLFNFLT
jgi:hypothetical protein